MIPAFFLSKIFKISLLTRNILKNYLHAFMRSKNTSKREEISFGALSEGQTAVPPFTVYCRWPDGSTSNIMIDARIKAPLTGAGGTP